MDRLKILLCDTINHPTPILRGWYEGLLELGHEAMYLPIPQYNLLDVEEDFDLIIYPGISEKQIPDFESYKKRHPNTVIVGCKDDWVDAYTKLKGIVDYFVIPLDYTPSVVEAYRVNGFKAYNVPLAGNSRLFYKESDTKTYDASFIGNLSHGYRGEDRFLYPILDKYVYFLGGSISYNGKPAKFVPYELHNPIRNKTKVNLNFHVPYQKPNKGHTPDRVDCNQSVFNIALSGNFQLCDHPLAAQYFDNNVVLGDESNWLDLFDYYLNNEQDREEKAHNAMLIAQRDHTWKVRMKQFLEINKKHNKDSGK